MDFFPCDDGTGDIQLNDFIPGLYNFISASLGSFVKRK